VYHLHLLKFILCIIRVCTKFLSLSLPNYLLGFCKYIHIIFPFIRHSFLLHTFRPFIQIALSCVAHKTVAVPAKVIMAVTTFSANYTIRISRENVGFRPGRGVGGPDTGGPSSAKTPVAGAGWGAETGDVVGVVINTGAADGDEWSGVAQAGDGKPNGESCAVGGDVSVGEDAGSGGGVAGTGFGFIGAASRQ
jgi:hypothetical protein